MAVQLQITLPLDWASDFDRVAERWYFYHQPSGFCQYPLPKSGDEITRAAELVPRLPPRPVQSLIMTGMEAMSIVQDKQQSTVTAVLVQQTQTPVPIADATQVIQKKASMIEYSQQTPLAPGSVPQQSELATIPSVTSLRRTSGPVARKPLPRHNSAPQQQQLPQAPIQQRQDSQISPRSSVSQTSITEFTMQQAQQQSMMSRRSSLSQTSITEPPSQQNPQRPAQSSRSSVSQILIAESLVQQDRQQPVPTNGASFQNQFQNPNGVMQPPQQPANPQHTSATARSPIPTADQDQTPQPVESNQVPVENPAVFWSEGFIESPQSPAQSQTPHTRLSRPKLANRLSSSAIKMPQKAYEASKDYIKAHPDAIKMPHKAYSASKDYIKAHPGRTTAIAGGIVGGIGLVAEVCGVSGLSDAVAASKIYLNVQRANQRKRNAHSLPQSTAHYATTGIAQNDASTTNSNGPSATDVAQELFRMMQQQGQIPSLGQNAAPQNNSSQSPNQGGTLNPQGSSQQYFPPQFTAPQFIPQQAPVQPMVLGGNIPFFVPPGQASPPLMTPDPSIADYQPPPSPTIPTGTQTPPSPSSQCLTPPLSFSVPSSQPPDLFDPSTIYLDPSTSQYDQFLQDQTSTAMANQAISLSDEYTASLPA